jgi:GntR family transcriptional regulator
MNKYFKVIEEMIESGELKPGEKIPSLIELTNKFNASEEDIKDVLAELVYEGEIECFRPEPSDVFIIPKRELWGTLGGSHSITKEARKRNQNPGVEILEWKLVEAWPSIARRLELDIEDKVQIMERLRLVDELPVAIEVSYFPAKLYPGITSDLFTEEGSGQSSFAVMEQKFGLKSEKAFDEVTVVCLEKREADALQVEPGTPVLERFRVTISDKNIPIKASRALWLFRAAYQMGI